MSNIVHWPTRFEEMIRFVGLTDDDRQLIKDSGPLVMKHARRLNDFIYDHLLAYPDTRKFFVTEDDKPDEKRIEDNKRTMLSWLRASTAAPMNDGFVRYLAAISQMHVNIPIHRPHLSPVPPRYTIGIIAYYQAAIGDLLSQNMTDATLALRTSMAWNKWMMVMLELLLAHYLMYDEESQGAEAQAGALSPH